MCRATPGARLRVCASRAAPSLSACEASQEITYRANLSAASFALERVAGADDRANVLICHRGSGELSAAMVRGPSRPTFPSGNVVAVDAVKDDLMQLRSNQASMSGQEYTNCLVFVSEGHEEEEGGYDKDNV